MILEVFNRYQYFGGEELAADAICALVEEDYPIERCFFDSSEWIGAGAPPTWRQAIWIGDNPEARRRVREASEAAGARIWLFHNLIPVASLGLYDEARRENKPVIQYIHNFRPFSPGGTLWVNGRIDRSALHGNYWPEIRAGAWQQSSIKTAILAWELRRLRKSGALGNVRAWIAISEFMRERFIEAGVEPERIHTIRHAWKLRESVDGWQDQGFYLFLGRLVEEKGVGILLEAWRRMEDAGGRVPQLVIAGDGPMQAVVEEAAAAHASISYRGFVSGSEKEELLRTCRVLLVPSRWWEPLGLVTYEAYDWEKPVIAAASGGLKETVLSGETGFLHAPEDVGELVGMVERMEGLSGEERRAMGRAGREWLSENANSGLWRKKFAAVVEAVDGA